MIFRFVINCDLKPPKIGTFEKKIEKKSKKKNNVMKLFVPLWRKEKQTNQNLAMYRAIAVKLWQHKQ